MKAAFTIWNDRISPVFDVAGYVLLLEVHHQNEISARDVVALPQGAAIDKLTFLCNQEVNVLVCGAISQPLLHAIEVCGIQVYPFCAGDIHEVIPAWLNGELEQVRFMMPGCRRKLRHRRGNGRRCSDLLQRRCNPKNRSD
ncbi:NifB/NifX family molybdenum-iron cluster-binding protein [Vibrio quintilis]|uniref:Dinitrogenase iron-molybdenum cofactor n=1 Tax=Vibrio quintilis TaxID=1117707 RepID=A0A1M7YQQ0_9VIBR|nr:NifB/NifX family molybdenum-iron cluster-binding protein [Vibrio quintilis]SHO54940.1 Dinitrogenase iron-molybdenum cofactor [Vibrio quintilis]